MAKFPQIKRISLEDFRDAPKEVRPTLERLIGLLNPFLTTVYGALAGNLTIGDNVVGMFKTFEITAGAAAINNTFTFTHTLKTKPQACHVVKVEQIAGTTVPITSPVFVSWHVGEDANQIEIDAITGLTAASRYNITVKVE
jgi:hypothetical protein